jgi:hypothetical protein
VIWIIVVKQTHEENADDKQDWTRGRMSTWLEDLGLETSKSVRVQTAAMYVVN